MSKSVYFIIVAVAFLLFLFKYRKDNIAVFLTFIFFYGLFESYGSTVQNAFKIFLLGFSLYLAAYYRIFSPFQKKNVFKHFLLFFLFSVSFYVSSFVNHDSLTLILSQYFSKYFLVFVTFFLFKKILIKHPEKFRKYLKFLYEIILLQIILSVIKFSMFGLTEIIVGSISSTGGALATTFPVFALIIYYFYRKGDFSLRDWLVVIGMFFIGFSSNKRAIWFILPIMMLLVMVYLPRKKIPLRIIYFTPLIPLIVYLGIRLNPSLNPDNKVWGTFDPQYTLNYTRDYSLGEDEYQNDQIAYGRVSSTLMLFNRIRDGELSLEDLIGRGQAIIRYTSYQEFRDYNTGLASKMATNGFYNTYLTTGVFGIITLLLWYYFMLTHIKNRRFRIIMIFYLIVEYFFYHASPMDNPVAMVLLTFIIWCSRYVIYDRPIKKILFSETQA